MCDAPLRPVTTILTGGGHRATARPKVFDDDMAHYARTLRASGVSVPEIAARLFIPTGKEGCVMN
jgi:hypothetical protein